MQTTTWLGHDGDDPRDFPLEEEGEFKLLARDDGNGTASATDDFAEMLWSRSRCALRGKRSRVGAEVRSCGRGATEQTHRKPCKSYTSLLTYIEMEDSSWQRVREV